jgi:hypothetical protein
MDLFNEWINRCARMTAGYVPGDIDTILRRMVSTANGRVEMEKYQTNQLCHIEDSQSREKKTNPEDSSIGREELQWRDFLSALSITPPAQLLRMQKDLAAGGVGGGSGIQVEGRNSSLSWTDFAGYEAEKRIVKSLIERFASVSNIPSSLSGLKQLKGN